MYVTTISGPEQWLPLVAAQPPIPLVKAHVRTLIRELQGFFLKNFSSYMTRRTQRRDFPFTIVPDAGWSKVVQANEKAWGEYLFKLAVEFFPERRLRAALEPKYYPQPVPYSSFGRGTVVSPEDKRIIKRMLLGSNYNKFHRRSGGQSTVAQVAPPPRRHIYFSASSVPLNNTAAAGTIAHEMAHVYESPHWYRVMNLLAAKSDVMEGITGQWIAFPAARDWSTAMNQRLPSTGYLKDLPSTDKFVQSVGGKGAVLQGYFGGWIEWDETNKKVIMGEKDVKAFKRKSRASGGDAK